MKWLKANEVTKPGTYVAKYPSQSPHIMHVSMVDDENIHYSDDFCVAARHVIERKDTYVRFLELVYDE